MMTGLNQMRCGNCGGEVFKLFADDETRRIGVESGLQGTSRGFNLNRRS
ncbi:hypothetical protein R70199_07501 [Paraburkholderia domus]|nr:hypothetical protein R70199_07501 [Paraburkholderia domus]